MQNSITVFGDINIDILVKANVGLSYDGDVEGLIELKPGGSGLGIAVWAKRAEPNLKINLLAKCGRDFLGEYIAEFLRAEEIELCLLRDVSALTGKCVVKFDENGGRTMISFKGANSSITENEISEKIIYNSRILHICGYTLLNDVQRKVAMHLCNISNKLNVPVSLNLAAYNQILCKNNRENLLNIMKEVSIVFANYEEGKALTKKEEPVSIVRELAKHVNIAVLTLGEQGCIVANKSKLLKDKFEMEKIIDTTGAGDAFVGVFLAKYIKGEVLTDCIKSATIVSSLVTQQIGTTPQIEYPIIKDIL